MVPLKVSRRSKTIFQKQIHTGMVHSVKTGSLNFVFPRHNAMTRRWDRCNSWSSKGIQRMKKLNTFLFIMIETEKFNTRNYSNASETTFTAEIQRWWLSVKNLSP